MATTRKILCTIFTALFVGMFLSNTIFPHSHIVKGILVVHSHPYNPFSPDEHQHSDDEVNLIAYLANTAVIESEMQDLPPVLLTTSRFIIKEYATNHARNEKILFARPRDPPANI